MAFFCPAGLSGHKRRKRTKIENIQKNNVEEQPDSVTEFEPTKMLVIRDFTPCVDDEVAVRRGQYVKALYQENEWRFVVREDGREGFIPYTYCIPVTTGHMKKSILKQETSPSNTITALQYELLGHKGIITDDNMESNGSEPSSSSDPLLQEFVKKNLGQYVVLFDYNALQEDDINAVHGEKVILLNKDDLDWYWVQSIDGNNEGFIPRQYLEKVTVPSHSGTKQPNHTTRSPLIQSPTTQSEDKNSSFEVKKLIVTCEFIAQSQHELTVKKDEEVFTDDKNIDQQSWIWVYSPQTRKSGFVPSFAVRWSQNTTFL